MFSKRDFENFGQDRILDQVNVNNFLRRNQKMNHRLRYARIITIFLELIEKMWDRKCLVILR